MDTVAEIGITEAELQDIVTSVEGTIEAKHAQLRELGVYRKYYQVFSRYLALFEAERGELEPLKRATFLAWYVLNSGPACFSGVNELPQDAHLTLAELLKENASKLGSEFHWMLAYYFALDPDAFPDLKSHPDIRNVLNSTDWDAFLQYPSEQHAMNGRGLMGQYWSSVFKSSAG